METTETIEVGDLVRVIVADPHFKEIPPAGAIGRVVTPYWNGMATDLRIVRYTCEANPVGDYEADYTLKVDEIELVDVAALSSDNPDTSLADRLAAAERELARLRERVTTLEDVLRPFAEAAEDETVKIAGEQFVLHVGHKYEQRPVAIYINGNTRDWKFLDVTHLRAARDALKAGQS